MTCYFSRDDRWGGTADFASKEEAILKAMDIFEMSRTKAEKFVVETEEAGSGKAV